MAAKPTRRPPPPRRRACTRDGLRSERRQLCQSRVKLCVTEGRCRGHQRRLAAKRGGHRGCARPVLVMTRKSKVPSDSPVFEVSVHCVAPASLRDAATFATIVPNVVCASGGAGAAAPPRRNASQKAPSRGRPPPRTASARSPPPQRHLAREPAEEMGCRGALDRLRADGVTQALEARRARLERRRAVLTRSSGRPAVCAGSPAAPPAPPPISKSWSCTVARERWSRRP